MKRILIPAAALALLVGSTSAWAKPDDHHDKQSGHSATPPASTSQAGTSHGGSQTTTSSTSSKGTNDWARGRTNSPSGGSSSDNRDRSKHAGHSDHDGMGHGHDRDNGDHRSIQSMHNFHRAFAAQHHFHAGAYHGPRGYAYRRWNYGERLPSIYFVRDYWITDYDDYGLQAPPYGYVWVRFGPDAILIDQNSGEIVEVVYGQFY
jgi:Ni/Co efflux regulator RcnB